MKHFKVFFPLSLSLFFVLIAGNNKALAQLNCDISIGQTMPVCPNIDFELSAQYYNNSTYTWKQDGELLDETGNTLLISIAETATFTLTITDNSTSDECTSEPFLVESHTPIEIDFIQLQLTCTNGDNDNGNNAKVKAVATGEFEPDEYHYFWNVSPLQIAPGDSTLAIGLKAHQFYNIEVRDNYGCPERDTVWTKAFDNPVVEITTDPDTAFIENPYVNFSYINLSEDTIQISNHYWDYGDCPDCENNPDQPCCNDISTSLENPTHAYGNHIGRDTSYFATLTVYNQFGCDTVYSKEVWIHLVDLFIPNVFTPNGDGINDYFIITENQGTGGGGERAEYDNYDVLDIYYESSRLVVFNRWGRIVYESGDYKNDWDGDNLPDGVYFYVLQCHGFINNEVVYKGSVTIFGSGR